MFAVSLVGLGAHTCGGVGCCAPARGPRVSPPPPPLAARPPSTTPVCWTPPPHRPTHRPCPAPPACDTTPPCPSRVAERTSRWAPNPQLAGTRQRRRQSVRGAARNLQSHKTCESSGRGGAGWWPAAAPPGLSAVHCQFRSADAMPAVVGPCAEQRQPRSGLPGQKEDTAGRPHPLSSMQFAGSLGRPRPAPVPPDCRLGWWRIEDSREQRGRKKSGAPSHGGTRRPMRRGLGSGTGLGWLGTATTMCAATAGLADKLLYNCKPRIRHQASRSQRWHSINGLVGQSVWCAGADSESKDTLLIFEENHDFHSNWQGNSWRCVRVSRNAWEKKKKGKKKTGCEAGNESSARHRDEAGAACSHRKQTSAVAALAGSPVPVRRPTEALTAPAVAR